MQIGGLVQQPLTLGLDDLKARPRQEVAFTLECSGDHGLPFLTGAVGNATWAGTPLRPVLEEAGVLDQGIEPQAHSFPVRLIAPGWYSIANVTWLQRIQVLPTRLMNRFMARDDVTIREQQVNGQTVWTETSVGRARLTSVPAKVSRQGSQYRIVGGAWGAPIAQVEVQIDDGPWLPATIDEGEDAEFAWKLWSLDWGSPASGEHTITSRATDTQGQIQPAQDDPWIAGKHTYWESNGQVTRRVHIA